MDGLRIRHVDRKDYPCLWQLLPQLEPEAASLRWRCEFGELVVADTIGREAERELHRLLERRDGIPWAVLSEHARDATPYANARLVGYERDETDPAIEVAEWDSGYWEVLSTSHSLLERIRKRYPHAESIWYPGKKSPWRWGAPEPGPIE